MELAKDLGMTLGDLLERMSPDEFDLWKTFHAHRRDLDEVDRKQQGMKNRVKDLHGSMRQKGKRR